MESHLSQSTTDSACASSWITGASVPSRLNLPAAIRRATDTVFVWRQRAYERRILAAMSGRLCKDLGLSNVDLWNEIRKPFWHA